MKWLQYTAVVVGILGGLAGGAAGIVVLSERISTKDQVETLDTSLRLGLREVAKCVDTPEYVGESDRAEREPGCETRLLRILDDTRTR